MFSHVVWLHPASSASGTSQFINRGLSTGVGGSRSDFNTNGIMWLHEVQKNVNATVSILETARTHPG